MKKTQKIIILALFTVFMVAFFFGCSNTEKSLKNKLSEYCETFFVSQHENFYVTLNSGKRELNYLYNGKTDQMVDFALITLVFKNGSTLEEIPFTLIINNNPVSNVLVKNVYKQNYMHDLGIKIDDNDKVYITIFEKEYELISQTNNFKIDCKKAEAIAIGQLNDKITDIKNQPIECYLKVVYKPEISQNTYWHYIV